MDIIIGEEKYVDITCEFIGEKDLRCYAPARLSSSHICIIDGCSHANKDGCPHYHWQKDSVEKERKVTE